MSGHTKLVLEIDYGGRAGVHRHEMTRDTSELTSTDIASMAKALLLAAGFSAANVKELFNVE